MVSNAMRRATPTVDSVSRAVTSAVTASWPMCADGTPDFAGMTSAQRLAYDDGRGWRGSLGEGVEGIGKCA